MKSKSIIIVIIILIVILAAGYFYYLSHQGPQPPTGNQPSVSQPQPKPSGTISGSDKTTDITNDLNQMPNDSAATQEMNSLDKNLQSF